MISFINRMHRPLQISLMLLLSAMLITTILSVITFYYYENKKDSLNSFLVKLNQINYNIQYLNYLQDEIIIRETINPVFYQTGKSKYLDKHKIIIDSTKVLISMLDSIKQLQSDSLNEQIHALSKGLDSIDNKVNQMIKVLLTKGWHNYGLEGQMRIYIHEIENSGYYYDKVLYLTIRRHEKDYLLRKTANYNALLKETCILLMADLQKKPNKNTERMVFLINEYQNTFNKLVENEKKLGINTEGGIKSEIDSLSIKTEKNLKITNRLLNNRIRQLNQSVEILFFSILFSAVLLSIIVSIFVIRKISRPINILSDSISNVVNSNFNPDYKIATTKRTDEIAALSKHVHLMLEKVHLRTNQLNQKREELETSFEKLKTLSKIGKKVTQNLNPEDIAKAVYLNLNKIFFVPHFALGLLDKHNRQIIFYGVKDDGQHIGIGHDSLDNNKLLSVWCLKNSKKVEISEFDTQ